MSNADIIYLAEFLLIHLHLKLQMKDTARERLFVVSPQSEKLACLEGTLESGAPTASFSRVRPRVLGETSQLCSFLAMFEHKSRLGTSGLW